MGRGKFGHLTCMVLLLSAVVCSSMWFRDRLCGHDTLCFLVNFHGLFFTGRLEGWIWSIWFTSVVARRVDLVNLVYVSGS